MTSLELFHTLQSSSISSYIGHQDHLVGAVAQLFHITGLILVLTSILVVSLRLLGLGLVRQTVPQLVKATARFVWVGLALLTLSGIVIFLPAAEHYDPNPIFWFKFKLLAVALVLHVTLYRKVTQTEAAAPVLAKSTAVVALAAWFGIAFAGRFIGFY